VTALSLAHGNNIIDASLGTASFVATVGPLKCRLMTANGTASTNGTQLTGGTYAPLTVTFGSAAGQSAANTNALSYTGLTVGSVVVGFELWDSAGTPIRKWWGPATSPRTVGADGTYTVPIGSLICAQQ